MFLLRLSRQTDFAVFWKYLKRITRWTFFRVKLIFEYDFQISWSFGPWVPWNLGLLDFRTFEPLPSSTTSSYFLLPPPISSSYFFLPPPPLSYLLLSLLTSIYLFLPPSISYFLIHGLVWYGVVWSGMERLSYDIEIGDGLLTLILMLESLWVGWWVVGVFGL